jgi:hypothetical protein
MDFSEPKQSPILIFEPNTIPDSIFPYKFGQPVERNVFISCVVKSFAISRGEPTAQTYYLLYLCHHQLLSDSIFSLENSLSKTKIASVFSTEELFAFYDAYAKITTPNSHVIDPKHPKELEPDLATSIMAGLLSSGFDQIGTGSIGTTVKNLLDSKTYDENPFKFLHNLNAFVKAEKRSQTIQTRSFIK